MNIEDKDEGYVTLEELLEEMEKLSERAWWEEE